MVENHTEIGSASVPVGTDYVQYYSERGWEIIATTGADGRQFFWAEKKGPDGRVIESAGWSIAASARGFPNESAGTNGPPGGPTVSELVGAGFSITSQTNRDGTVTYTAFKPSKVWGDMEYVWTEGER